MLICQPCLQRTWPRGTRAEQPSAHVRCAVCGQAAWCLEVPDELVRASVPEVREPYLGPPLRGQP